MHIYNTYIIAASNRWIERKIASKMINKIFFCIIYTKIVSFRTK